LIDYFKDYGCSDNYAHYLSVISFRFIQELNGITVEKKVCLNSVLNL